jgi:hypothetical protein
VASGSRTRCVLQRSEDIVRSFVDCAREACGELSRAGDCGRSGRVMYAVWYTVTICPSLQNSVLISQTVCTPWSWERVSMY